MNRTSMTIAALCTLAAPAFAQTEPRFIRISPGPDGVFAPLRLSPDGSTVIGTVASQSGSETGYVLCRWTLAAGLAVLPRSPVQLTSVPNDYPVGLSRDGSIIGTTVGRSQHMAARWSLEFGFEVAPQLDPGNQQTESIAMSADGRYMIGSGSTNGGYRAFRADFATQLNVNLSNVDPNPTPDFASGAYGVDATGNKVVGNYSTQGSSTSIACLWENGATRTTLVCPPPFAHWYPNRISGNGQIITGRGDLPSAPAVLVPFRWSAQSGAQLLPIGPFWVLPNVQHVNYTGDTLAGEASIDGVQHGILWLPGGGVTTVDAFCDAHDFERNGLHFFTVSGLSADGKVVLISGNRGSPTETWMIRLPGAIAFCASDLGGAGGQIGPDGTLDNNDFITFIAYFFTRNARADVGKTGGLRGSDFTLDNNDFIVFINEFFDGCQ